MRLLPPWIGYLGGSFQVTGVSALPPNHPFSSPTLMNWKAMRISSPLRSKFSILLALFGLVGIKVFFMMSYKQEFRTQSAQPPHYLVNNSDDYVYLVKSSGCSIPAINPFHPISLEYYKQITEPYSCPGKSHFIKHVTKDSIELDANVLRKEYNLSTKDLSCSYRNIHKAYGDSWDYGPRINLTFRTSLPDDYLFVECVPKSGGKSLEEFVSLFPSKPELDARTRQHPINLNHSEPLNVIIVGIDSISKLNFMRHFVQTHKYLRETLKAFELHGYHKVDDNSFPNLTPFLTGHFKETYWNENNLSNVYFDDADFLWKHYRNHGYRTLYFEDMTAYGTFNFYKKKGFKEKPVDYYYRPMSKAMETSQMAKNSQSYCFKNKMEIQVLWDYLLRFTKAVQPPNLYFAFTFVSRIIHNDNNYAGYADRPTYELLKELHDSNVLNKTILVLFSDHGIRVGGLRKTLSGYYEERMPMFFLSFPEWFLKKYPRIHANLKTNERRLTTHFDVHATLYHFLNFKTAPPFDEKYRYGISLFSEIPENRTCAGAALKEHWCACKVYEPQPNSDPYVQRAALVAVNTINSWLRNVGGKCTPLKITKLHTGSRHTNTHWKAGSGVPSDLFLVIVETHPGGGIFEATIEYYKENGTMKALNDIGRVNNYGSNGWCLTEGSFEFKYCYCVK